LSAVNRVKPLHCFQLDHHNVLDHEVYSVSVNDLIAVADLNQMFGFVSKALVSELDLHGLVINGLNVACTEGGVHRAQPMTLCMTSSTSSASGEIA
jgi:hypothetical protein